MVRSRALRLCLAALTLALLLLVDVRLARAQPSLDLTWSVPREAEARCPDQAWVVAAVRHLVTSPASQSLKVVASVREEEGQWVVDLELSGAASGARTLRACSCKSVARGAALIVALALDPQASALASDDLAPPQPPPAPPVPPPVPAEPPAPPAPRAPPPPPTPEVRPIVFLGASAGRALLPGIAAGGVVGGGLTWRAMRADLAFELAPGTSASLSRLPAVGADLSLAALALRTCAGHSTPWMAIHGCAALRGVRIAGEGTGLAQSYRQTAHLLALEPGALVRVPGNTRLAVELDAAAVIPFTHPDFVILSGDSSERLFRVSPFGVRVALAASFRF